MPQPSLTPAAFATKWRGVTTTEKAAAQEHFIDLGVDMSEREAALYEAPFEYVRQHVRRERLRNNRAAYAAAWWLHVEPRSGMRTALSSVSCYVATIRHSKHRLFAWFDRSVLPDSALIVFAVDDDYTFGVLHSHVHELWSRAMGTQVREVETGFRYTPTTCFETFPFPDPTPEQRARVGDAARRLVSLRDGWLNAPRDAERALAERTLTSLYNERPSWLRHAHAELDAAVLAAYGWSLNTTDAQLLEQLLALNLPRAHTSELAPRQELMPA